MIGLFRKKQTTDTRLDNRLVQLQTGRQTVGDRLERLKYLEAGRVTANLHTNDGRIIQVKALYFDGVDTWRFAHTAEVLRVVKMSIQDDQGYVLDTDDTHFTSNLDSLTYVLNADLTKEC